MGAGAAPSMALYCENDLPIQDDKYQLISHHNCGVVIDDIGTNHIQTTDFNFTRKVEVDITLRDGNI